MCYGVNYIAFVNLYFSRCCFSLWGAVSVSIVFVACMYMRILLALSVPLWKVELGSPCHDPYLVSSKLVARLPNTTAVATK